LSTTTPKKIINLQAHGFGPDQPSPSNLFNTTVEQMQRTLPSTATTLTVAKTAVQKFIDKTTLMKDTLINHFLPSTD